jgi:AraC-like DNA-binding protein
MPIDFFKQIKTSSKSADVKTVPSNTVLEHIEGFYRFSAKELKAKELLYNDGFPVLVFMADPDSKSKISIDGAYSTLDAVWMCGGELKNVYIHFETPAQDLFVVRFNPASFYRIFNLSTTVFKLNPVLNLVDVLNKNELSFIKGFYACLSLEMKIAYVESFVSKIGNNGDYPFLLRDALEFINKEKGIVSVQEVVKRSGTRVSHKWLGRNFQKFIGVSPQKYILLQRFLNAYIDLNNTPASDPMDVAVRNGYYDYNHLIKDFKRYAGTSPKLYFLRKSEAWLNH